MLLVLSFDLLGLYTMYIARLKGGLPLNTVLHKVKSPPNQSKLLRVVLSVSVPVDCVTNSGTERSMKRDKHRRKPQQQRWIGLRVDDRQTETDRERDKHKQMNDSEKQTNKHRRTFPLSSVSMF